MVGSLKSRRGCRIPAKILSAILTIFGGSLTCVHAAQDPPRGEGGVVAAD